MEDDDLVDYLHQLQEGIFEAYTGVLQGLRADSKSDVFLNYVQGCLNLLVLVSKVTEQRNALQKKIERLENSLRELDVRRQEVQRKRNQAELELSQLQAQLERKQDLEAQRQESERSRRALQTLTLTLTLP